MAWLADARIDRARELLETTTEPVENIGRLTGLGAPASVRAAFHRRLGISPQDYRSLFRHHTPPAVPGGSVVASDLALEAERSGPPAAQRERDGRLWTR